MALTIKDVLQLQSLQGFQLHAGQKGLSRYVVSAGIGDYEFCSDVDFPREEAFEPDSLILSSLLFAKGQPELLLPAVQQLFDAGVSGLAYKTVIFDELPTEVLDFCNSNEFPLFSFGSDTYFENIIYEVMNAVRVDDADLLSENNIRSMIENEFPRVQVSRFAKMLSLAFKGNAMGVYIKPIAASSSGDARTADDSRADTDARPDGIAHHVTDHSSFDVRAERCLKNLYLNRNLNDKVLLCLYDGGIFALLTAHQPKAEAFEVILTQLLEFLGLDASSLHICRSDIHPSHKELDFCFRESYQAYLASVAEARSFGSYHEIGMYKFLIPQLANENMQKYAQSILESLRSKPEYFDTVRQLVLCGGDTLMSAEHFGCHQNTIRYRLQKIKALLGLENETEQDFYAILATAMRLHLLEAE